MKNYYEILGVSQKAEAVIIKAAYRASAKKYHPDTWKGNKSQATERLKELNEAYTILSDPTKRKKYDKEFKGEPSKGGQFFSVDNGLDKVEKVIPEWKIVEEYYPDIENVRLHLEAISVSLSLVFQFAILENKEFEKSEEYSALVKKWFLQDRFGTNEKALKVGERLFLNKKYKLAEELSNHLNIMGNENAHVVVEKFERAHFSEVFGVTRSELLESYEFFKNTIRKQYNVPKIEIEFYKNFDEDTNTYNARINVYKYFARPQPYLLLELNMDFLNCKIDADMAKVEQFEQIAYRNLQEAHQFLVKIKTKILNKT